MVAALVLLLVYFVVTGLCVMKGYRLKLEKVAALSATSPDAGSFAEGAARLVEVISTSPSRKVGPSQMGSPSNFSGVHPLVPVPQIFLPNNEKGQQQGVSSASGKAAQLEIRRWSMGNGKEEGLISLHQYQQQFINKAKDENSVDKSMNTSMVLLHSAATETEKPETCNRASSAVHNKTKAVATSFEQFSHDQSTDTTTDVGNKVKSVQTSTVNNCFDSMKATSSIDEQSFATTNQGPLPPPPTTATTTTTTTIKTVKKHKRRARHRER